MREDASGNVAILFAFAAPVLLAAAGAAVEYASLSSKRAELQRAADAAALAGAKTLAASSAQTTAQKEQQAHDTATRVAAAQAPGADGAITPSVVDKTVTVALHLQSPLRFASFLGSDSASLGAKAQATYSTPSAGCLIALGETEKGGIALQGAAKVVAPRCDVASNKPGPDSITMQGAPKMTAQSICAVGGTGKARTSPPPKSGCAKAADPYQERPLKCGKDQSIACASFNDGGDGHLTKNPSSPVTSWPAGLCDFKKVEVGASTKGTVTLSPGVYCGGLDVQSADVYLLPGFYQMQDGPLSVQGNGSVSGSNVSILLSGANAVLDLQGSPKVNLSAMTSGPLAGIAIASNTAASSVLTSKLQGSPDLSLTGSLWLPNQVLDLQGSPTLTQSGNRDKVVVFGLSMTGSPDLVIKAENSGEMSGDVAELRLVK